MAKILFALEPGGEKRLQVSWKGLYKETSVYLDDQLVGTIQGQKALASGQDFTLIDGSLLHVQLVSKVFNTELQVLRNGQPLPGSASDPQARLKAAYIITYFIAGLNLVLGIVASLFQVELLQELGIGIYSLVFGLIFLVLAIFIQRKSMAALIIAIVIFIADGVLGFVFAAIGGASPSTAGVLGRIILLIPMFQGIGAIKALKKQTESQQAPQ
ncbi:MAG: hypothetical protein VB013_03890 [Anaerolineaceae bacterium]|nr:hypothetical protein [Anaerolineaceae bacterium]